MYCKSETLKLACEKGFTQCTCSAGGYPDCICDSIPYDNIRLEDIQRWLREKHNLNTCGDIANNKGQWEASVINIILSAESNIHVEPDALFNSYDEAVELAVNTALNLI